MQGVIFSKDTWIGSTENKNRSSENKKVKKKRKIEKKEKCRIDNKIV